MAHGAAGKLMLIVGCRPQYLTTWVSPFHAKETSCSQSKWAKKARQRPQCFSDVASEVTLHHFCIILFVTQVSPNQSGKEWHRSMSIWRWEPLEDIFKPGCHIVSTLPYSRHGISLQHFLPIWNVLSLSLNLFFFLVSNHLLMLILVPSSLKHLLWLLLPEEIASSFVLLWPHYSYHTF